MLQSPTNLYPENVAFDPTVADEKSRISFKFNGAFLSAIQFKIYDYVTGELVKASGVTGYDSANTRWRVPLSYNGDIFQLANGTLGDGLATGKDYILQMILCQCSQDGTSEICDMVMVRGNTQANYTTSDSYLLLKSDISAIFEWDGTNATIKQPTYDSQSNLIASMEIEIGGVRRRITSYDTANGHLTLASAFPNNMPSGTPYQIYCNYLISREYFFQTRTTPTCPVSVSYDSTNDSIEVNGTYSQAQNSLISYYTIDLYYDTGLLGTNMKLIKSTDKIYSQKISHSFEDISIPYVLPSIYYIAVVNLVTVDEMTISYQGQSSNMGATTGSMTPPNIVVEQFNKDNPYKPYVAGSEEAEFYDIAPLQTCLLEYPQNDSVKWKWFRKNLISNAISFVYTNSNKSGDVTVPNKGEFRYYLIPFDKTTGRMISSGVAYKDIEIDSVGYSISELVYRERSNPSDRDGYSVAETWRFVGEISDTTMTQNIDHTSHIGYGRKPVNTTTNINYLSGTLSAFFGYVECTSKKFKSNIEMIQAWRDFITRPSMFLLKSQKGDVLLVNIVNTPQTSYQENALTIPTQLSFDWVECEDINNIRLINMRIYN